MAKKQDLELLRTLLVQCDRIHELERADYIRRIKEQEREKPQAHTTQLAGRERLLRLLKVMQQVREPLTPRELAPRLDTTPQTVSRWLAAARQKGYVERVSGARYQLKKEVPPL
jgi:DNA-binding MarR family transcriptional regulator